MKQLPQLSVVSPLPPSHSGIADYTAEQLPYLAKHFAIDVLVDDASQAEYRAPANVTVSRFDAEAFRASLFGRPILYHVGNNIWHEYVLKAALQKPGFVVLHDFVLHHLIVEMTLAKNDPKGYRDFLEYDYGDVGRTLADQRENYAFTSLQEFLLPLNGKVLDASKGAIVHSRWAQRQLNDLRPGLPVAYVPHHFYAGDLPRLSASREEARRKLGLPPDALIFLCIGHITPPKQVELVAKALGRIKDQLPPFMLLLVGEASDPEGLQKVLKQAGIANRTRLTGRVQLDAFQEAIIASDLVCNLRYPTAGESSGTLTRALGIGRCCVIFDYASFSDYGSDICLKVPLDTFDPAPLANALLAAAKSPEMRTKMAEAAKAWVRRECAIGRCAQAYADFIERQEAVLANAH